MKKLLLLLLFASQLYSQEKVYNVQQYCIDELPFSKGQCDVKGNEYSFVFVDSKKSEVVFFLTNMKMKYKIISVNPDPTDKNFTVFELEGDKGISQMRINEEATKIEFLYPNMRIYLTVGKSTKL